MSFPLKTVLSVAPLFLTVVHTLSQQAMSNGADALPLQTTNMESEAPSHFDDAERTWVETARSPIPCTNNETANLRLISAPMPKVAVDQIIGSKGETVRVRGPVFERVGDTGKHGKTEWTATGYGEHLVTTYRLQTPDRRFLQICHGTNGTVTSIFLYSITNGVKYYTNIDGSPILSFE